MKIDGYTNINAKISDAELGLGWISGITLWGTSKAVKMEPHRHSTIEMIFCLKGELTYDIEGHGSVTIGEGTCVIMPARTTHVLKGGTDAPCVRLGLHINGSLNANSRRYGVFSANDYSVFHAKIKSMTARPFRLTNRTLEIVRELVSNIASGESNSYIRGQTRTLASMILYRIIDTLSHPLPEVGISLMSEATRFIESHYNEKFNINDLVHRMGYGRTQVFNMFKNHTGLTPNEYLIRHRIRMAQKLINSGKTSAQVAKAVGFSSTSYFRSVFRKYTGSTPL